MRFLPVRCPHSATPFAHSGHHRWCRGRYTLIVEPIQRFPSQLSPDLFHEPFDSTTDSRGLNSTGA